MRELSAAGLRGLAMAAMLIDHIGALLLPELLWLRVPGRLAFPLFAFLLCQGFTHTRSRRSYGLRLLAVGLLSELPFDLAFQGAVFDFSCNNIFFTLLLGLGLLGLLERGRLRPLWLLVFFLLGQALRCDYGGAGVLLIALFYLLPPVPAAVLGGLLTALLLRSPIQLYAALAALPLYFYRGRKGRGLPKWLNYGFYPAHLLVLLGIRGLL